jgi:hypothetical protein
VHGRTRLLALVIGLACLAPASATAAPLPAGTYDVQLTNGTLDIGDGLLPAQTLNSGTAFAVPIGTSPIAQPIGLTVPDTTFSGPGIAGTATVTVTGAGVTIDPTTGGATLDASFYISATITGLGSCTIGSSGQPISVHLTTANGSPWDAVTNAFSMTDNTFALPAPSCSPSLISGLLTTFLGNTGVGNNIITLIGTAIRRPDPVPPVTIPPTSTTQSTSAAPTGGGTQPTTTAGAPTTTSAPAAKRCVVPRLVGKTLKQAKRALKKAGCKPGKAKGKYSKKRKKGRILTQRYKAGTKLPAGAKVPLAVSRGQKQTRKH